MLTPQVKARNLMLTSTLGDARQLLTFPPVSFLWSLVNTRKQRRALSIKLQKCSVEMFRDWSCVS